PQNLEEAQRQAAAEGKDIFILFGASDSPPSHLLTSEVLTKPGFQETVPKKFVPVWIDASQQHAALLKMQNGPRNRALIRYYNVFIFPTVGLTDAQGKPYGRVTGYDPGQAEAYWSNLLKLQDNRVRRDRLLAAAAQAQGADQLAAAKEALK